MLAGSKNPLFLDMGSVKGDTPISVRYMFDHQEEFQIGERHSQDK